MAESPVKASPSEVLGADYEILGEIGGGGACAVYYARDRQLGREVAVKVIRDHHLDDAAAVARFEREARLLAPLHHPNILSVYGGRRLNTGVLALVMQPPRGRTLRQALDDGGALPIAQAARVLRDVASALRYLHRQGIVHRNLKPENILLDGDGGRTQLFDFGISKPLDDLASITLPGVLIGTPAYMAPEQISGAAPDVRSDLYSLGVIGYEMLHGRHPWAESSLYGMLFRQQTQSLPPVAALRPDAPPPLRLALEKAVIKDPAERWRNADEMLQQLLGTEPGNGAKRDVPLDGGPLSKRAGLPWAGAAAAQARTMPPPDAAETDRHPARFNRRRAAVAAAIVVLLGAVALGSYLINGDGVGAVGLVRGGTERPPDSNALSAQPAAADQAALADAATAEATAPAGAQNADSQDVQALLRRLRELEGQVQRSPAGSEGNAAAAAGEEELPARRVDPGAIPGALPVPRPVLPIRIAAPQSEPVSPPQLRNGPELRELIVDRYPRNLRREGVGDTITISLLVDASGRATALEVTGPSAHPALNAAALEVAARMLFDPARQQGQPVPVRITVPIVFRWQPPEG